MVMRHMRKMVVAAAVAAAGIGLVRQASAAGLADHVPGDALLFVEWPGTAALGPAYDQSNLKGIVETLDLKGRITKAIEQAAAKSDNPDAKAKAELVKAWMADVVKNEGAVYIGPIDFSGDKPMPKIAVLSKVGATRAAEIAGVAKAEMEKQKKEGDPPVNIVVSGDYLVLDVGKGAEGEKWVAGPLTDSLGASAKYQQTVDQTKINGTVGSRVYVNGEAAVQAILEGTAKASSPEVQQFAPVIIDSLGLMALRQIGVAGGFDGPNSTGRVFVGLEGDRKGIWDFFDFPPLKPEVLGMIPQDVAFAGAFRFDGNRIINDIRDAVVKISPQNGAQGFDGAMRQVYAFTGVDLQKDLFASLGDTYLIYATPEADKTIQYVTVVSPLKDAAKAEEALTGLETFANQMMTQRGPGIVTFNQEALASPNEKVMAHEIKSPAGLVAWAIKDGVLYVSGGKEGVEKAMAVKGKGFAANADFQALQKKLGAPEMSSFSYSNVKEVAPGYYAAVTTLIDKAAHENDMEAFTNWPPFSALEKYMGPGAQMWWTDQAGIHGAEEGPFIGWNAMNPQMEIQNRIMQKIQGGGDAPAGGAPATPGAMP